MINRIISFVITIILCLAMTSCSEKDPYTVRTDLEDGSWIIKECISEEDLRPNKLTKYYPAGNIDYEIIYEYNKNRQPLSIVQIDEDGSEDRRINYTYTNGVVTRTETYEYGFLIELGEYEEDGLSGKSTQYDVFGKIKSYFIIEYDEVSEKYISTYYDADGTVKMTAEFTTEDGITDIQMNQP